MTAIDPLALSDEEFDTRYADPTPIETAVTGGSTLDLSDEQFDARYSEDPKIATKAENQFDPGPLWMNYYGEKWKDGQEAVARGVMGFKGISGAVTYEDIQNDASVANLKALREQTGSFESTLSEWDVRKWVGRATESLPFMMEVIKGGATGAVGGAVLGGGAALAAGQLGPQVAVPEELATVPIAARVGWEWGWRAGAFTTSGTLMAGQTYLDFRDAGLDDTVAKPAAIASGAVSGLIETAQLGQLGGVGRKAFVDAIQSTAGQSTVKGFLVNYFKEVGVQVGEEELQTMTQLVAQSTAALVSKNPGAVPTADEIKEQIVQTFIQSTQASLVLVGGSKAGGKVAGETIKAVAGKIETQAEKIAAARAQVADAQAGAEAVGTVAESVVTGKLSVVDAFKILKEAFETGGPTEEEVKQTKELTMDQALDEIFPTKHPLIAQIEENVQAVEQAAGGAGGLPAQDIALPVEDTGAVQDPIIDEELPGKPSLEVQGRINQVTADIKIVDKQINDLERQMVSMAADDRPTTAVVNKLEKLYDERSVLDDELVTLNYETVQPEDLKGLDVKLKAEKITALRAKAVNESLKSFRKGVKEGISFTKDQIRGVQTELISLVRKSGLALKDQAKFIQRIRTIQNQTQLMRALPEVQAQINRLIEADARRTAAKYLGRVVKQAGLSKAGKRPVGKYTAPVQKILDAYTKAVVDKDFRDAALQRNMEDMQRHVDNSQNLEESKEVRRSQQEMLETFVAQRVGDLENKNSNQITALADEIKGIIDTGKAAIIEKKMAEAEEREARVEAAVKSINGVKPIDTPNLTNSKLRLTTFKNNSLTRLLKTLGRTISSWDGLMAILSQHDQGNKLRELADVFSAVRQEYAAQEQQRTVLIDTIIKAVGSNKQAVLDRIVSGTKKQEFGRYVDALGKHVTLYISRNEAIKLWMQFHDTDLQRGLREGNKYTLPGDVSGTQVSTYQLLEEALTDTDKKMAEGLQAFYDNYYDRVNTEWEDETGASLIKNDTYSGYARREGSKENATQSFFQEQFSRATIKPASTIIRTDNAKGLLPADAFVDAIKHVHDFEHWIAWRKVDKAVRSIFTNRDIRNTIKLKYGEGMMQTVDDRYHDMIGTRVEQQHGALDFLDTIRRNAGTAFVGGKALQFFKQMTAITTFLLYVDEKEFLEGVTDFVLHPKKAIETMEQSPMLKARMETFDRDWMEAMQRDDIEAFKEHPSFTQWNMMAVKWGDRGTIWSGGWAVYKATLEKTGDPEKAMIAFEKAFNATQSSGTPDQLSQLERSGPWGKMMTIFLKQPLQMLEAEMAALRKAAALPSVENTLQAMRTVAIVHAAQVLFQAAASAPGVLLGGADEDEEATKLLRAAILGPFAGLPILGDMISAMGTAFTNWVFDQKEYVWKPKSLPYDAAGKAVDLWKDSYKFIFEDASGEQFFKVLHDYARSVDLLMPAQLGGGVPKEPYLKLLEPIVVGPDEKDKPKEEY